MISRIKRSISSFFTRFLPSNGGLLHMEASTDLGAFSTATRIIDTKRAKLIAYRKERTQAKNWRKWK